MDEHYTLSGVRGSLPNQSTCFVDLEKVFDRGGVLRDYGMSSPLMQAVRSLYDRSKSLVCIADSKSDSFLVSRLT